VRLSYSDANGDNQVNSSEILEENNYYPFGLEHKVYNNVVSNAEYPYKYNGKELQDELGLNWYDYQARNYDPALGRWMNIDPLAEQYRRWSLYNYCVDNPMRFVDPDGMGVDDVIISGAEKQKAFSELQASVANELTLSMDTNGKVSYTYNGSGLQGPATENGVGALSSDAQQLVDAIDNSSITVNVTAENTKLTSTGNLYIGGAFMGNTVTPGDPLLNQPNTVVASQEINPNVLSTLSSDYNKPGADTLHEVTEAYQGALTTQKSGVFSPMAGQKGSVYPTSHASATPQSGSVSRALYDAKGNQTSNVNQAVKVEYQTQKGTVIMTYP